MYLPLFYSIFTPDFTRSSVDLQGGGRGDGSDQRHPGAISIHVLTVSRPFSDYFVSDSGLFYDFSWIL